jgi:hypothetical protein
MYSRSCLIPSSVGAVSYRFHQDYTDEYLHALEDAPFLCILAAACSWSTSALGLFPAPSVERRQGQIAVYPRNRSLLHCSTHQASIDLTREEEFDIGGAATAIMATYFRPHLLHHVVDTEQV